MTSVSDPVSDIERSALRDLSSVSDAEQLETWRLTYLGRKGRLTQVLRGLAGLDLAERRSLGAEANRIKVN
jgi:phenylalanyl-tRNA synthetase alpha chain